MPRAERILTSGLLAVLGALLSVAPAVAQTTHESMISDTAEPYTPGYPFLPESDPMVEVPTREEPSADIMDDMDALFHWQLQGRDPERTPADFNRVESLTMPDTTPNLPFPDDARTDDAEMELRGRAVSPYDDIFKSTRVLGMYSPTPISPLAVVPEPRRVFEKNYARRYPIGPVRFATESEGTFNYIDNLFGARRNKQGDFFYTFQPRLYLETGSRSFMRLLYMPNFTRFATYREFDSQDENWIFNLRHKFSKLEISSDLAYLTQNGLFVNAEEYSKARSYVGMFQANYPITRKTGVSFDYAGRNDLADPGGLAIDHSGMLTMRHQYSPAISIGGAYQLGRVDADFGTQIYQTHQIVGWLRPGYHFVLDGRAGFQVRQFSQPVAGKNGLISPVYDLAGSYHWNDNTAFVLRFFRTISTVTFDQLHLGIETGVDSYALVRFFGTVDIKAQITGGHSERMANIAPETGDFRFLTGGLSVSWTASKMLELTVYTKTQRRFADSRGVNFTSTVSGIGCKVRF